LKRVVRPVERRAVTRWMVESYRVSLQKACRASGTAMSSMQYRSVRPDQSSLRARIREIATTRVSYGYRRVQVLLRREGWKVNAKRTYRLYREEELCLRLKRPWRRSAVRRQEPDVATRSNLVWAMDFMSDALADGRKLRVLTVIGTFTRECVALEVGGTFGGAEVARVLTRAGVHRGLPETIHGDNGTEFTSKVFDQCAYANRVKLDYSRPGKPTDNAFIESFNA
jgi:putative transposase